MIHSVLDKFIKGTNVVAPSGYTGVVQDYCKQNDIMFSVTDDINPILDIVSFVICVGTYEKLEETNPVMNIVMKRNVPALVLFV